MANQTVTAVFDRYEDARSAVNKLEAAGVPHQDISLVSNDAEQRGAYGAAGTTTPGEAGATGAGAGATVGTVVGGGAGALAGLGMLAIPGLGPVVAAGWLVATLVGAGVGAAAGGLLGSLTGAGVSETDAHAYAEAVRRGGTLVTVRADDANHERVVAILDVDGAVDLNERQNAWRSEGWTGTYPTGADAPDVDPTLAGTGGRAAGLTGVDGAPGATPVAPTTAADRARVRSYPQS